MAKGEEGQTIQWQKEKKDRQYNDKRRRRTDNTMTKGEEGQTIQWQKEKKDRQYNDKRRWTQRQTMVNKIVHKNLKQRTNPIKQ
jgi:hypothetical protein